MKPLKAPLEITSILGISLFITSHPSNIASQSHPSNEYPPLTRRLYHGEDSSTKNERESPQKNQRNRERERERYLFMIETNVSSRSSERKIVKVYKARAREIEYGSIFAANADMADKWR
jgi:hypothetical protein